MRVIKAPEYRYIMLRPGIGPVYAEKGGHACIKWDVSWRKLAGFYLNTNRGCWWFYFRRAPR
jgi:hypothetical protein